MKTHSPALSVLAARDTPALQRARAMGFDLERADVYWTGEALQLIGHMRCVCGRVESFDFVVSLDPAVLDPARLLHERDAFGEAHLRGDGYTDAEIAAITDKGRAYDLARC